MAERYVRPPLLAREAPPAWLALWCLRLITIAVLALLVLLAVLSVRSPAGATAQDPGVDALSLLALPPR